MSASVNDDSASNLRRNSRSKTYNNPSRRASDSGSYTDYSESFYSDDGSPVSRRSPAKGVKKAPGGANTTGKPNGKPNGKPAGRKANKAQPSPRQLESVTQRMLSAGRSKVNNLRSQMEEMNLKMDELKVENKVLKKQQRLQEKALVKFEGEEGELSQLLRKHSAEVGALRAQVRRQRAAARQAEGQLKQTDDELGNARRQMQRLRRLVDDGELGERDELARRLTHAEAAAETRDRKTKELEAHVEHLKKNHRHEIGIERARQKDVQREFIELQQQCERKELQLKEKEKELDIRNIYSNRLLRPPHKLLSSVSSSPLPPSAASRTRRPPSDPLATPRGRQQNYEAQRRDNGEKLRQGLVGTGSAKYQDNSAAELRNDRVPVGSLAGGRLVVPLEPRPPVHSKRGPLRSPAAQPLVRPQSLMEKQEKDRLQLEKLSADREVEHQAALKESAELRERDWWQREQVEKREREAEHSRERHSRERHQLEEEQQQAEERRRRREEERLAEERETEKRREEQARREREQKEEQETRDRESRLRAQEEEERRAREEAERLANSASEQERRRRKDNLLAKLRDIDNSTETPLSPTRTEYTFSKPVENMHNGLPALERSSASQRGSASQRTRKKGFFDDDGGNNANDYKPSFGSSKRGSGGPFGDRTTGSQQRIQPQDDSKADLMAQLFGPEKMDGGSREASSTALFGGGNAIVEDDATTAASPFPSKAHLLPRRTRQPATTVHARPTINAIDDFDDDLEEVTL